MLMDAMDHVAYNPEDCLPLFGTSFEMADISLLENGDSESVDDYPFSPIIETLFGHVSLTSNESVFSKSDSIHYPPVLERPTDECCGLANLDEVPMELDTSDEESFGAADQEPARPEKDDYSAELDEIELRSRALRSLLLKKSSPSKSPIESRESATAPSLPPASNQFSKLLSIGSGKHVRINSQDRFIITICDTSSDSDEEIDSKPTDSKANPDLKVKPAPQHQQISHSLSEPSIPEVRDHRVAERQLLQQKLVLLRHRLTVKRQQRIVDERRQIVRKLTNTLNELRKRLKHVSSLYRQASKSLLQAQRIHTAQQKKLLTAQRSYSSMCEKLSQTDTHWSQLDLVRLASESDGRSNQTAARNHAAQRKDLVLGSLNALQRARSTTAYFAYYRFDCGMSNASQMDPGTTLVGDQICKLQDSSPCDSSTDRSKKSISLVNPTIPLCPFLLDGECKDATCLLQHPPALLNVKPALNGDNGQVTLHSFSSNESPRTVLGFRVPGLPNEDLFCDVCKEPLISSREVDIPTGLRKWHSAFLAYKRSSVNCVGSLRKFLVESQALMKEFANCEGLSDHHLTIMCLQKNDDVSSGIIECLKLYQFPLSACRCVLRNPNLSVPVRIAIARSTIKHINSQIQRLPSPPISPLGASLVYIVYHCSRLLLETKSLDSPVSFLEELLSTFPKSHPCRFGIWWIKLSLNLTHSLPEESSFFSSANFPIFPKTVILENLPLIQEACSDLGIPEHTMDIASNFLESDKLRLLSNCFLALCYLHVHSLLVTQQYENAIHLCWRFSLIPAMQTIDDLFYPLGVYASFHANNTTDWTTASGQIPELVHSGANLQYRIEYGFLVANLAWRKNMLSVAREALLEPLASLVLITSDTDSDVVSAFQRLLHPEEDECFRYEITTQLGLRGHTYLWLSYCLYCIICSTHVQEALNQLISYCKTRLGRANSDYLFDRLLLHMTLSLINKLHASNGIVYCEMVVGVLCNPVLTLDRQALPMWFIELVQRIQLSSLSSPGERHDLCVALVETYGPMLIPSFCRGLFALGDLFLARSLCSIGRLDKPDSEAFWLLFASLVFSDPVKSRLSEQSHCLPMLIELFADATAAIPSSASLWSQYTRAMVSSALNTDQLHKRAKDVGMAVHVLDILGKNEQKNTSINTDPTKPNGTISASSGSKEFHKRPSTVSTRTKPTISKKPVNAFKLFRKVK